jgi:hypothetical protein
LAQVSCRMFNATYPANSGQHLVVSPRSLAANSASSSNVISGNVYFGTPRVMSTSMSSGYLLPSIPSTHGVANEATVIGQISSMHDPMAQFVYSYGTTNQYSYPIRTGNALHDNFLNSVMTARHSAPPTPPTEAVELGSGSAEQPKVESKSESKKKNMVIEVSRPVSEMNEVVFEDSPSAGLEKKQAPTPQQPNYFVHLNDYSVMSPRGAYITQHAPDILGLTTGTSPHGGFFELSASPAFGSEHFVGANQFMQLTMPPTTTNAQMMSGNNAMIISSSNLAYSGQSQYTSVQYPVATPFEKFLGGVWACANGYEVDDSNDHYESNNLTSFNGLRSTELESSNGVAPMSSLQGANVTLPMAPLVENSKLLSEVVSPAKSEGILPSASKVLPAMEKLVLDSEVSPNRGDEQHGAKQHHALSTNQVNLKISVEDNSHKKELEALEKMRREREESLLVEVAMLRKREEERRQELALQKAQAAKREQAEAEKRLKKKKQSMCHPISKWFV